MGGISVTMDRPCPLPPGGHTASCPPPHPCHPSMALPHAPSAWAPSHPSCAQTPWPSHSLDDSRAQEPAASLWPSSVLGRLGGRVMPPPIKHSRGDQQRLPPDRAGASHLWAPGPPIWDSGVPAGPGTKPLSSCWEGKQQCGEEDLACGLCQQTARLGAVHCPAAPTNMGLVQQDLSKRPHRAAETLESLMQAVCHHFLPAGDTASSGKNVVPSFPASFSSCPQRWELGSLSEAQTDASALVFRNSESWSGT